MSPTTRPTGSRPIPSILIAVAVVAILAVALGHPAVGDVLGGAVILGLSFQLGRRLTGRLAIETDPGRELTWDVLLVLVVVLALVGVGVMAAAIP